MCVSGVEFYFLSANVLTKRQNSGIIRTILGKGNDEEEYIPHRSGREKTVGASLGAGGMEVAAELWIEWAFFEMPR